ncbi:MAG: metal-sensing transcriptional repressor [Candidatus Izemoplasmatales bacterium]|nr:metal-sensing transcriptional repressor [Candidatus Izemoplasmatales bacterium]MDD3864720.1 metal-sensing transcriptional repressor [Candidatus Izemoplasmatales bacterium]
MMRADPKTVKKLLNTARGQIDGIGNMIEENRYCIDISTQILAAIAVLKKANQVVIQAHLENCVRETLNEEGQQKITEIVQIINKIT